jgi:hypothetical protein
MSKIVDRLADHDLVLRYVKAYNAAMASGQPEAERVATACVLVVASAAPLDMAPEAFAKEAEYVRQGAHRVLRNMARRLESDYLPPDVLAAKMREAVNAFIVKQTMDGGSV